MRLICPNCGAQYEIGDDAIPEDGRDVQCSNCGHTWFQVSANAAQENDADEDPAVDTATPDPDTVEPDADPDEDHDDAGEDDEEDGVAPPAPGRRPLPEDVQSVLQQEAAFEEAARKAEAEALEYQQDLGLSGAAPVSDRDAQARERMARLRGLDPEDPNGPPEPPEEPSRKELLPDIEEINSTLRGGLEHASVPLSDAVETPVDPGKRGFRIGFGLALIIAAALTLAYVHAPKISAAVPALASTMDGYVSQIDTFRRGLEERVKSASDRMSSDG